MIDRLKQLDLRFVCLVGLLVFLPSFEAPKNLFALLFAVSWVVIAKRENNWGGKWRVIDTIFLLWILADIAVSINAVITHQLPGENFRDIIRFVLIAWVLSRTNFSRKQISTLALIAVVSTVVTILYGYSNLVGGRIELNSVGHINHTAIYLLIAYALSLSLLSFNYNHLANWERLLLSFAMIVLFVATVDTESRATMGFVIIVTLFNMFYFVLHYRKIKFALAAILICTLLATWLAYNPSVALQRIQANKNILQDVSRDKIRNFSYYAFKTNPILGVGLGNFGKLNLADIEKEVINDYNVFDTSKYLPSAHAHNVYYTYLISGGVLLFSIFTWFWFYIAHALFKLRTTMENRWIFVSSASVVMINLGVGWVNTTLHHEHAILSMFVLGILISQYRKRDENIN
jgi:O-antigen ligase